MPYIGNTTADFSIDTGNITNKAVTAIKLSPSSVGSNGQVLSVDGSGNLQWGNDANAPEGTAVLSTGESGTAKYLRIDGDGTCSWQVPPNTQLSFSNDANNRIVTGTGSGLNGEANLTFDGNTLSQTIATSGHGASIKTTDDVYPQVTLGANRANENNSLGYVRAQWNNTDVAAIDFLAGPDTTNKDDGKIGFNTRTSGGGITRRMTIDSTGWVGAGETSRGNSGQVAAFKNTSNANSWLSVNVNNNTGVGGIVFGDSDSWAPAYIQVNHSTNNMEFINNGAQRFTINSNGNVGIGTTSPATSLEIASTDAIIRLTDTNNSAGANDLIGELQFYSNDADGPHIGGFVKAIQDPSDAYGRRTALLFGTQNNDVSTNAAEKVRIDCNGKVLIGTTTTGHANADELTLGPTTAGARGGLTINAANDKDCSIHFGDSDSNLSGQINYDHNGDFLSFYTGGTKRVRIDSDGLKFGVSASANDALNDYEEGTFTPGLTSTSAGNFSFSTQLGVFTKVGNWVHCSGVVTATVGGTETGSVRLTGFPFTSANTSANYGQLITTDYGNFDSYTGHVGGYLQKGATYVVLLHTYEGSSTVIATSDWGTNTYIYFNISYKV
jgi:hypothetical protein